MFIVENIPEKCNKDVESVEVAEKDATTNHQLQKRIHKTYKVLP